RILRVRGHALAQDLNPGALRQPVRRDLPGLAAVLSPVHAEPPIRRDPVAAADLRRLHLVLRNDEGDVRSTVIEREREAERAREAVALEALPAVAVVVGAVDAAVALLPQTSVLACMEEHLVDALADLRERIVRHEVCCRPFVLRLPRLAAVLRAEDAGG